MICCHVNLQYSIVADICMACILGGCVELSFLVPHYFIISCMHDYSLPFSVLTSRMCHVIVHLIIPFVPLLYCSVVIHMHILPCTLVVIILVLFRTNSKSPDNTYRYSIGTTHMICDAGHEWVNC